jgi:glycosyltransferase involved in cell wall biosynthesis
LNTRPFLQERIESILGQTFNDWELIIVDDYSTDGAWEFFQAYANSDPRISLYRGSQKGLYAGWNSAIERATGEFIYIATSDDTMHSDCLTVLVGLLDEYPNVGIAQCGLEIIDENSQPLPAERQWENFTLGVFDRNLVTQPNLRLAPHDGLLHTALFTICTSVTQVLVRRSIFDRLGLFERKWGSIGDFEWHMRVGLTVDCIFTPEKLASWRQHSSQATGDIHTAEVRKMMIEMARHAFERSKRCNDGKLSQINIEDFINILEVDLVELGVRTSSTRAQTLAFLANQFAHRPRAVITWLRARISNRRWDFWNCDLRHAMLRSVLRKYNIREPVYK